MADMTLTIEGAAAKIIQEGIGPISKTVAEKFAEAIKQNILNEINRSIELSSFVGQYTDQESIRTILRSVNVKVSPELPPVIEASIKDEYGHWYGGIPEEINETLQSLIDDVMSRWAISAEPSNIFAQVLMEQ